ncbi:Chloroperoxidase [Penicillium brevicompactum]|uniref:Chloroperoxidase n=1 Tax=Penicillium brevicompactum TaxID=5074 RepID=UPI002540A76D|nr:Chloroperoxidase [Penicillium brevicompactum]KAJ5325730.1 Chloroperoxidase [Penicillium brevicompactum]
MGLLKIGLSLFGLVTNTYGWEHLGHEWHAPFPSDSRSPCPGLNAMANHGYLPRSGSDIDLATLRNAVASAYNYEPTAFDIAFEQAVGYNITTTGNESTINLVDLARHEGPEFDGSLSRNDIYFGDDLHFDYSIWKIVAQSLNLYDTLGPEAQYVTVEMAAKARAVRVKNAKAINPTFNASDLATSGSPGTTGVYLTTLWDDRVGAVPKSWIRAFFGMCDFFILTLEHFQY